MKKTGKYSSSINDEARLDISFHSQDSLTSNDNQKNLVKEKPSFKDKLFNCLKNISFGQYRTPLYFKESDSYSSVIGGILTVIGVFLIMVAAIFILKDVGGKDTWMIH